MSKNEKQLTGTESKILKIKTIHSIQLKTLFDILHDISSDCTMEFIKGNTPEENIIKIYSNGTSDAVKPAVYVYVKLFGKEFVEYFVKYKEFKVGINFNELHKFTKAITKDSILTISVDMFDKNTIDFSIESSESNKRTHSQKITDWGSLSSYKQKAPIHVYIETREFKSICSQLSQYSDIIEITCTNNKIVFFAMHDKMSSSKVECEQSEKKLVITSSSDEEFIVRGIYSLKHLCALNKCDNLCTHVQLYLTQENDTSIGILFLKYSTGILGTMLVGLSPIG